MARPRGARGHGRIERARSGPRRELQCAYGLLAPALGTPSDARGIRAIFSRRTEVPLSVPFTDLRSLYRAAERDAVPTRADKRAVRTAIFSAGIATSALHAATASGKLISLIPGGAKVFTLGQVVAYA